MAWEGNNALKKKKQSEASVEIKDGGKHKQLAPNQTISFIAADIHIPDQPVTGANETKNRKQTNKKHTERSAVSVGWNRWRWPQGASAVRQYKALRICAFS